MVYAAGSLSVLGCARDCLARLHHKHYQLRIGDTLHPTNVPHHPGGTWFQTCTPVKWVSTTQMLTAKCPGNVQIQLNYGLCASGASVAYESSTLTCSAVIPAINSGAFARAPASAGGLYVGTV